jgi:hypothetical protein
LRQKQAARGKTSQEFQSHRSLLCEDMRAV